MSLAWPKRCGVSTECLNSSQRQLTRCVAVISHSFAFTLLLVPCHGIAGSVSKKYLLFIKIIPTQKTVTTINQAMDIGGSCNSPK